MAGVEISAAEWRELVDRRWTEDDARRVLAAWRASGDSAYGFARDHGLNAQRLSWWSKRLGEWEHADVAAGFAPADVTGAPMATGAAVVVHVAGVVIEAEANHVDARWLATLVRGLDRDEP